MKEQVIRKNVILAQIDAICELGGIPHLVTYTDHKDFIGPLHLSKEGFTVFSIGANAVRNYSTDDTGINFTGSFTGKGYSVSIPYSSIAMVKDKMDNDIQFHWGVELNEEDVNKEEIEISEEINNGAPVGTPGWKPSIVS